MSTRTLLTCHVHTNQRVGTNFLRWWRSPKLARRRAAPRGMNQPEDKKRQPQIITPVNSRDDPLSNTAGEVLPCSPNTACTEGDPRNWEIFEVLLPGVQVRSHAQQASERATVRASERACVRACVLCTERRPHHTVWTGELAQGTTRTSPGLVQGPAPHVIGLWYGTLGFRPRYTQSTPKAGSC